MNFIEKIKNWFWGLFDPKVDWKKIDKTCIVFSDYPKVNNGWIKGCVHSPNTIIVCSHSNPSVGSEVFVVLNGEKIKRKISLVLSRDPKTDVTICHIDSPWPDGVKIYKVANKLKENQQVATFHQDKEFSLRRINLDGDMVSGRFGERKIIAGDSGCPWIVWDEKSKDFVLASHNYEGKFGTGPNYSKLIKNLV